MDKGKTNDFVLKLISVVVAVSVGWILFEAVANAHHEYPATNYPKADKWFDGLYPKVQDIYCEAARDHVGDPEQWELSWVDFDNSVTRIVGWQHAQRFINQKCGTDWYVHPIPGPGKMWKNF